MHVVVQQDFRALKADASEYFFDKLNESTVIDRLSQLDVAEVTWTLILSYNNHTKGHIKKNQ